MNGHGGATAPAVDVAGRNGKYGRTPKRARQKDIAELNIFTGCGQCANHSRIVRFSWKSIKNHDFREILNFE